MRKRCAKRRAGESEETVTKLKDGFLKRKTRYHATRLARGEIRCTMTAMGFEVGSAESLAKSREDCLGFADHLAHACPGEADQVSRALGMHHLQEKKHTQLLAFSICNCIAKLMQQNTQPKVAQKIAVNPEPVTLSPADFAERRTDRDIGRISAAAWQRMAERDGSTPEAVRNAVQRKLFEGYLDERLS